MENEKLNSKSYIPFIYTIDTRVMISYKKKGVKSQYIC